MKDEKLKTLFRNFMYGDAPPQGELDGRYYEIKVDHNGKTMILWKNTIYQITEVNI
jgi:hypothetical protein